MVSAREGRIQEQAILRDERTGARDARAKAYFEQDLRNQREWYGSRAGAYKQRAQMFSMGVIGAGAATSFLQVFSPPWVTIGTAALGALVVLLEGWQRIARYAETWVGYRTASERMKRERRLYVNGAGNYRVTDEEEAYLRFVEAVEGIIAEEQQLYWQVSGSEPGGQGSAAPAGNKAGQ